MTLAGARIYRESFSFLNSNVDPLTSRWHIQVVEKGECDTSHRLKIPWDKIPGKITVSK